MLFSAAPSAQYSDAANVMVDLSNPASKPFVKVSAAYEHAPSYAGQHVQLDKSASLSAESQLVPVAALKLDASRGKQPRAGHSEPTQDLGGTAGSVTRQLNRELDEIERLNAANAQEFPGSLRGSLKGTLDRIPEDDGDTLKASSKFEPVGGPTENRNPNASEAPQLKLDGTLISDPKLQKGSMKIEKFEGFPELPEYAGIQARYLAAAPPDDDEYADAFEGTGGSLGTGKSIDFEELQKKLVQKTAASPYKPRADGQAAKPERKKWGKDAKSQDTNLEQLQQEMEGIDKLLEQFGPKTSDDPDPLQDDDNEDYNDRVPIYETEPDNFNKYDSDTIRYKQQQYRPKLESIMEATYEQTQSKNSDFLSASERKLIQEELKRGRGNDN